MEVVHVRLTLAILIGILAVLGLISTIPTVMIGRIVSLPFLRVADQTRPMAPFEPKLQMAGMIIISLAGILMSLGIALFGSDSLSLSLILFSIILAWTAFLLAGIGIIISVISARKNRANNDRF